MFAPQLCSAMSKLFVAVAAAVTLPAEMLLPGPVCHGARRGNKSFRTHTHTHTNVHVQENVSFGRIRKSGKTTKMTTEICDAVQICESDRLFGGVGGGALAGGVDLC